MTEQNKIDKIIERINSMQEYLASQNFDKLGLVYNLYNDCKTQLLEDKKALEYVVNRENLMFAECSDAEEILNVCKSVLRIKE